MSSVAAGGGAILFLPIAAIWLEPREIPPVIALAAGVSSVQRCWLYRGEVVLPVFAANVPGLLAGSVLGAFALRGIQADGLSMLVAVFLVLYAAGGLLGVKLRLPPARPIHFAVASFGTASLSALVGASGPVMNPVYLQAGILKEEMIGTKAASSLTMQVIKLGSFLSLGLLGGEVLRAGLLVGAGALAGNLAGKATLGRLSGEIFSVGVRWMLLVSGVLMLWRALAG